MLWTSSKVTVSHTSNHSYTGDRNLEDQGSIQSQPEETVHETLSQKQPITKKTDGLAQEIGPEFKLQYHKKQKQKQKKRL
jgi:hypothetical protein